ncbi:hypothetical protein VTK56DRAFT_7626 [Thermocarpiscus australiensis]
MRLQQLRRGQGRSPGSNGCNVLASALMRARGPRCRKCSSRGNTHVPTATKLRINGRRSSEFTLGPTICNVSKCSLPWAPYIPCTVCYNATLHHPETIFCSVVSQDAACWLTLPALVARTTISV